MSGKSIRTVTNVSLAELVRAYLAPGGSGPRLDVYLGLFQKCSLREAIQLAGYDEDENIHPHQRRLGRHILTLAERALLKSFEAVRACRSFDELHELVASCTRHIDRFGVLARYDIALRIGAQVGVWPERVYLHAGAKVGCKKLGIACRGKTIEPADLPGPIGRLPPHNAENFLCVYKGGFGGVRRVRKSGC